MIGTYNRLNVSIYASAREVIRAARKRLNPDHLRVRAARIERHRFYKRMLDIHKSARDLAVHQWRM